MSKFTTKKWLHFVARGKIRYLVLSLLTGVLIVSLFFLGDISRAKNTAPRKATFDPARQTGQGIEILTNAFKGNIRVYPNGETPTKTPSEHPVLRSSGTIRDQLWVSGDSQSWAHFRFWQQVGYQEKGIDPLVQAGADRTPTRYTFPCEVNQVGTSLVGWGLTPLGSSACEHITISHGSWQSGIGNTIANKSNFQKLPDRADFFLNPVTISRAEELALIQIHEHDGFVAVDVLVGTIQVSPLNSPVVDVSAGNRYLHTAAGGRIETIDLNEIVNSQSVETFLDGVSSVQTEHS